MSSSSDSAKEGYDLHPLRDDLTYREEVSEVSDEEEESSDSGDFASEYEEENEAANEEEDEEEEEFEEGELEEGCKEDLVNGLIDDCGPSSSGDSSQSGGIPSYLIRKKYAPKRVLPPHGSAEYKDIRRSDAKMRMKRNNDAHSCPHCDYTAPYPNKIKLHVEVNHTPGRFPCAYCSEVLDTKTEQRRHVATIHPMVHKCEHCGLVCKRRADVEKHIRSNHVKGMKCTVKGCNQVVLKRCLKRHLAEAHSTSLEIRTRSVVRRRRVRCTQCDYSTLEQDEMEHHVESVHGDGIKCPFEGCEAKVRIPQLDEHMATEHANNDDTTMKSPDESLLTPSETVTSSSGVDLDDLLLPLDQDLDETITETDETENNTRPSPAKKALVVKNAYGGYACTSCGSGYDSLYLLKKHIKRVHEKAYAEVKKKRLHPQLACTWEGCTKTFRTQGTLEDHLNGHKNVFPYRCEHCDQSFSARATFAVHLSKYHQTSIRVVAALKRDLLSVGRQYNCTWEGCRKTFRTPYMLEDHLNVHKNIFPYKCTHCHHSFRTRLWFRKHLAQDHQMSIRDLPDLAAAAPSD